MFWFVSDIVSPSPSRETQVIPTLSVLEGHGIGTAALDLHFFGVNSTIAMLPQSSDQENLQLLKMLTQKGDGGRELKTEILLGSTVRSN